MYSITIQNLITLSLCGRDFQSNGWWHKGLLNPTHNILMVLDEGECTLTIDNRTILLKKNDITIIPKNAFYIPYTQSTCSFKYFHFDAEVDFFETTRERNFFNNHTCDQTLSFPDIFHADDLLHEEMNIILSDVEKTSPEMTLKMNTTFINILIRISESVTQTNLSKNAYEISRYISENLPTVTLTEIADYFKYSKQHIIRIFKENFQTTPTAYIIDQKLSKSIAFLNRGDMSVEEIAAISGFSDPNYFTRQFKRKYSIVPSDYRKKITNGI